MGDKVRVQLDMDKEVIKDLDKLRKSKDMTRAGIIREALKLYGYVNAEAKKGATLQIKHGGKTTPVVLLSVLPRMGS